MKRLLLASVLAAAVLAPAMASADVGFTVDTTALRAGPGPEYPRVDRLPPDVRIWIHGCIDRFDWCDVTYRGERGWMPGDRLVIPYEGRRVRLYEYGPRLDVPIIAFNFDGYWGEHYRGRSFYGDRGRWRERAYAGRRDEDRDGVPNRFDRDRDGDGVPNRFDSRPDNRRRD